MVKINGKTDLLQTEEIELMKGVFVTVNGLPFGYQTLMEEAVPSPVPPRKQLFDSNGKPLIKNKGSKEGVSEPDKEDPAYLAECRRANLKQTAWMVYHGTKKDPNLIWDADPEKFPKPADFYQAVYEELIAANFGPGHVDMIAEKVLELSGMSAEKLERIKEKAFLSRMEG